MSATRCSDDERYGGARSWRQRKTNVATMKYYSNKRASEKQPSVRRLFTCKLHNTKTTTYIYIRTQTERNPLIPHLVSQMVSPA